MSCSKATVTGGLYALALHDALPIWSDRRFSARSAPTKSWTKSLAGFIRSSGGVAYWASTPPFWRTATRSRSEEHTSELQSLRHLVCRLLLEKEKKDAARPQGRIAEE